MKIMRRILVAVAVASATVGLAPAAQAAVNPVLAAPYLYQWSNPPNPVSVMNATGIKSFTLAFVLSNGNCNPAWDGNRSLTGSDITRVNQIRAAGGDAIPSIGGWSGNKLGSTCSNSTALAAAYQKVINAGKFTAIDLDIENTDEFQNATVQDRILGAVKIIKQNNPGVRVVITIGTTTSGPDSWGNRIIERAKAIGAPVDVWAVMPFDFSSGGDMVGKTKSAVTGLKNKVKSVYGLSDDAAFRRSGLSSMNGHTDNSGEVVTVANFKSIVSWANSVHLARVSFWALNRDCNNCAGISQGLYDFTKANAAFTG
ncbi:chitinase [Actinocrispum sp. NPDC049592]|uniref:chitinase n=1 Tax=Actinocrispum sp. NPDC049592 TaxID=3154835 RepID=UPI00342FCEA9